MAATLKKIIKLSEQALLLAVLLLLGESTTAQRSADKPNIVIIMADDMGFDDVSFRGSNHFLTPNIDALAYSGVILKNLYTPSMCTPSRAALLTGKYPTNTGMQHYVIPNYQPWSLPTDETTIAEIFQENGYFTALLGKWHLGMSRKAYTPTMRGFDHHFGYLGAYIDYYDHTLYSPAKNYSRGHDFRNNLDAIEQFAGTYVTDLLTEAALKLIENHAVAKKPLFLVLSHLAPHSANEENPLQAPALEVEKFSYIQNKDRRVFAAMMSELDKSVGRVVDALAEQKILDNTIILFLSDNGGPTVGMHGTTASNYPLKGQKNSPWEGGLRSSAAIWSTQFEKLGTVWKQNTYIADFLPTLAAAAGIELDPQLQLDGLNLWSALKYGYESVEREIVHNIDEIFDYVSYAKGKWKLVNGTTEGGHFDGWLGSRSTSNTVDETDPRASEYEEYIHATMVWNRLKEFNPNASTIDVSQLRAAASVECQFKDPSQGAACKPLSEPCFFDIDIDPCEQNNLYEQQKNSKLVQEMWERVGHFREIAHTPNNKPEDPRCDPANFHNEWTWWEDEKEEGNSGSESMPFFTLAVSSFILSSVLPSLIFAR